MNKIKLKINQSQITINQPTQQQSDRLIDAYIQSLSLPEPKPAQDVFTAGEYSNFLAERLMEQSGFTPTNPDSIELKPIKDEDIAVLKWDDADAPLPDDEDDRQDMADQAIDKDIGMEEAAAAYSVSLDPPLVDDQQEEEPPPPPNEIVYVDPDYKGTSLSEKLREAFQAAPTSILANEEQVNPFEPVSDHYAETQDWRKSGIKYRLIKGVKNTPTFRVRWQCPKCQDRGNHYVPKGADVVYCYTCKTKLKIEDATKEGFPNRDSFGNFYVATKEKWAHARA